MTRLPRALPTVVLAIVFAGSCAVAAEQPPSATVPSAGPSTNTRSAPPDAFGSGVVWGGYRSDALAISFEYPVSSSMRGLLTSCIPVEEGDGIRIGERGYITSTVASTDARQAAQAWIAGPGAGFQNVESTPTTFGGVAAITVGYRFGGVGRFGYVTFAVANGRLYQVGSEAGDDACATAAGFTLGPPVRSVRFLAP